MLEKLASKIETDYGMKVTADSFVRRSSHIFVAEYGNSHIIARRLKWGRWKIIITL